MSEPTETAEGFFEATSPFGTIAGWEPQDGGGDTTTKDRASALGADGDEFRHVDHNEQKTVSATYIPDGTVTTKFTIPAAGSLLNGWVIDSVSLAYTQDFPVLTLNGHKRTKVVSGLLRMYRKKTSKQLKVAEKKCVKMQKITFFRIKLCLSD